MKITSMSNPESSPPALTNNTHGFESPALPSPVLAPAGGLMTSCPVYIVDAIQRSILFLDLLRRRGNEEIEITSRPMAHPCRLRAPLHSATSSAAISGEARVDFLLNLHVVMK